MPLKVYPPYFPHFSCALIAVAISLTSLGLFHFLDNPIKQMQYVMFRPVMFLRKAIFISVLDGEVFDVNFIAIISNSHLYSY